MGAPMTTLSLLLRATLGRLPIGERLVSDRLAISGVLISSVSGSYALLPDAFQGDLCITDSFLPGAPGFPFQNGTAFQKRELL